MQVSMNLKMLFVEKFKFRLNQKELGEQLRVSVPILAIALAPAPFVPILFM